MKHVYREALVPYSQEQMYSLVNNIKDYPQFLPWCKNAYIIKQNTNILEATLVLAKGGIHKSFTTKNILFPYENIKIELVNGPFKHLQGDWRFLPQKNNQVLVSVDLEFEFSSKLLTILFGPVFQEVAQTLAHAFITEADNRYGK